MNLARPFKAGLEIEIELASGQRRMKLARFRRRWRDAYRPVRLSSRPWKAGL